MNKISNGNKNIKICVKIIYKSPNTVNSSNSKAWNIKAMSKSKIHKKKIFKNQKKVSNVPVAN